MQASPNEVDPAIFAAEQEQASGMDTEMEEMYEVFLQGLLVNIVTVRFT